MQRSPLLIGVGGTLLGTAALMVVFAVVYNPVFFVVALPIGLGGYLIWLHGTGRIERLLLEHARRRQQQRRRKAEQRDPTQGPGGAQSRFAREARQRFGGPGAGVGGQRRTDGSGRAAAGRTTGASSTGGPPQDVSGMSVEEAYRTLGLDPGSDEAEIRKAYRERAKEVHPDTADGDEEAFKELNEAYETLKERVI